MLTTITKLSTKNVASQAKEAVTNPEILLALRQQRLEARLEAIEPCLFKYASLLTHKYHNIDKDAENPDTLNNTQTVPVYVKLKA